jgi:hypothetical protein
MRTAGVYLIYAAVTLRALVRYADEPQRGLAMVLLATYGLILLAEPWISQRKPLRLARAANSGPGPALR